MPESLIRGLTLHEPWAYAIAHLGKDVENRGIHALDWSFLEGHYLAIHSAVTIKVGDARDAIDSLREEGYPIPGTFDTDTGEPLKWKEAKKVFSFGHIVAVARVEAITGDDSMSSFWRSDSDVGIWLSDVVTIDPLPCKGYQGTWFLPGSVFHDLRDRYKAAVKKKEP